MVEFVLLGALFGPGAPDPDLARFRTMVSCLGRIAKHGVFVSNVKDIDPKLQNHYNFIGFIDMLKY